MVRILNVGKDLSVLIFMLIALVFLNACGDDDDDMLGNTNPEVIAADMEFESGRGTTVDVGLELSAPAGIQSLVLSVDDGPAQDISVNEGVTEASITHSFTIPEESVVGETFALVFTLMDQSGGSSDINVSVVTGKLIEVPDTYEFTRDSESTVHHPGQTDRLDMVAEMKSNFLSKADNGEVVTEQAMLAMFENNGGNGGNNFTFTSDRQLKNKTFAPDLDNQLFEDLFERLEAASTAASQGAVASNGVAGLITRENKGSTILVDENGREFTQFIEKGLMGAVFYNQIFNVYLTDERTGDNVENVEFREGSNDTPMEHGMDEAFGYWDPPLDFTSPWPEDREDEDRFWSHYSNVVDNVRDGMLGTNEIIMDAYIRGRTAIVNNDLEEKNAQRDILYENLELVAAAVTVHYINLTLGFLDEGKTGEAFHVLSEAWAFANALKYSPRKEITLEQIETIQDTYFGADGNFWNVTPEGLNMAKSLLIDIYPTLEPVKDDL